MGCKAYLQPGSGTQSWWGAVQEGEASQSLGEAVTYVCHGVWVQPAAEGAPGEIKGWRLQQGVLESGDGSPGEVACFL